MKRTNWFDRKFTPIEDNGIIPCIIERLEGTPARLSEKLEKVNDEILSLTVGGKWSIKKEAGHLIDLEPLWLNRMKEIISGNKELSKADLTNSKTHEADHDDRSIAELITRFRFLRQQLIAFIRQATNDDLNKTALHPRLGTPMRVVDLAYFVAEHDDHHLAQITFLATNENNTGK